MLESSLDKTAFSEAYQKIVHAYGEHLPVGSRLNASSPFLEPETFEACWAAECHRKFWKPERIRLALIAESHVYTDAEDLKSTIRRELLPADLKDSPAQFVRLIYCLGYGDNSLLTYRPRQSNQHTDFWDIFAECAGMDPPAGYPLTTRITILEKLKHRGVWLADASIHACMNPRFQWNSKIRDRRRNIECFSKLYREVVNASWAYVKTTIPDESVTWIIGKCVRDAIRDPALDKSRWFYQPGAGLGKEAKILQQSQLTRFRNEIARL